MALIITRDRQRKGNLLSRLQFTSHDFFFYILVAILERSERESFIQQKLHSHGSRAPRMHARRNVIAKGFQLGRSYSPYDRYGTIQHYRVIISIFFFSTTSETPSPNFLQFTRDLLVSKNRYELARRVSIVNISARRKEGGEQQLEIDKSRRVLANARVGEGVRTHTGT